VQSRTEIIRARWQLWLVTFAILTALAGLVIYLATSTDQHVSVTFIPSRVLLAMALAGMVFAFVMYAVDRERNLHRLADRLIKEQLEGERLGARLQYLAELTRERDTNAALLEGSADGVVVLDGDRRIRRFNPAMETLSGLEARAVTGRDFCDALRFLGPEGDEIHEALHPVTLTLADGVARAGMQMQLVIPGGTHWVSATFSPVLEGDHPVVVLCSLRDIAEQKEQEAMQRDFVSMAAHELRSPLTAIKGFTRTLISKADQIDEERRTRYLTMVNEQSDRLARLVDDLMQVSRIDAQRLTLDREYLDVATMVETLAEQFRTKWSERPIDVVLGQGELPAALADPHKVEEILINLIDNAIKYSPDGAPVEVCIRELGGDVRVDVRDHGAGIAREDQASLFQKFHRLPASKARDIPGTGLGLYIVKGFVEAHGGEVWVESEPGKGATFSFTIPASEARVAVDVANG
jgi:PAS domain S-box-containing protein